MKYSKKIFENEAEKQKFVLECERDFEKLLDDSLSKIWEIDGLKAIGLSGPTCSGKTTAAKKLIDDLSAHGRKVHVISIDDFFKDTARSKTTDEAPDFDSVNAIDLDEFVRCTEDIYAGKTVKIPRFDFVSGKRTGYVEIDPDPTDVYIFEGIQAIYPEVVSALGGAESVYICVKSPINVGGVIFEPNEIRLMRRIVRDYNFRGADPEYSMFLWQSVRANEEKSIFPNVGNCNVQIDSAIPYEINVLVQFLRPLLMQVKKESKFYAQAAELLKKTEGIESIPSIMIPDGSIYYEFVKNEHIN